jgi:myosin heavy subunit
MFRTLCGDDCLPNVLLVTSMWDTLLCLPNGRALGEQREAELIEVPEFWGAMTRKGAKLQRHDGTKERVLEIVRSMMGMGKITTAIQEQLAEGVTLGETDAGQVVNMMNAEKVKQLRADAQEHINEQKKINEGLQKEMQEAEEKFKQLQRESQQARQQAEEVQRQQLSVSEEQKRDLDKVMRELKEKANKADTEAEAQKKKVQEKRDEAKQASKDIDSQVDSVNKAIFEREQAAERLKMSAENRRRFWLMGAAQTVGSND